MRGDACRCRIDGAPPARATGTAPEASARLRRLTGLRLDGGAAFDLTGDLPFPGFARRARFAPVPLPGAGRDLFLRALAVLRFFAIPSSA
ncbi:MAG: hypothetical protein K8H87_02755, partial [Pseudorhodoplanes sp.]|nr:hypothetical protein [Pseudorhodoplanes sp.]